MIRAIIIDDELHCISRIKKLLAEYHSQTVVLAGAFQNVADGLKGIRELKPELVFLDVQINEETGFDLLRSLPEINFEVIFTTAFEKYAVQAFKFSALDYLLKPVDPDDLQRSLTRLQEKLSKEELTKKMEVLFHNLKEIRGYSKKISIPTLNGYEFLQVSEILHCQSNINYTTIYLKDHRKLTVAKTLKEFEDLLSDYNFYRVHNSHLINLAYLKNYHKGKGGSVVMIDDTEIEVSLRRKEGLLQKIAEM